MYRFFICAIQFDLINQVYSDMKGFQILDPSQLPGVDLMFSTINHMNRSNPLYEEEIP